MVNAKYVCVVARINVYVSRVSHAYELKMTCALNFSQTAAPLERTLEMMQFEVGMGSTHTILTHSPAFDVPNGKTKAKTIEYKNWRRFFSSGNSPEAFPQPKGTRKAAGVVRPILGYRLLPAGRSR